MLNILIFIAVLLAIIIFYIRCVRPHNYWKRKGVLQGPSVWMFGETWRNLLKLESYAESIIRVYRKFPSTRYFGTYQFNKPVFVVKDIELLKNVAIRDFDNFADRRVIIPATVDPLWGNNLFSLNGPKWKDMRVLLTPAFTISKMKSVFIQMKEVAEIFVNHFEEQPEDVIELNFTEIINRFNCDVIASTAFGIKVNSLKSPKNEFYELGTELTDFTGWRSLIIYSIFILPEYMLKALQFRIYTDKISKFFTGIVEESMRIREETGIIHPDVIQLLMEARKGRGSHDEKNDTDTTKTSYVSRKNTSQLVISNTDIVSQATTFFFGGFDEVSTEMKFMVYELAVHPDIQSKLRNEIHEAFENCQGQLTHEDLMQMNYLDMVVSETLRKWPSNGNLERICTKPYTIPALHPDESEITLEEGTTVWLPIMGLHYDPQYYPDPEKFDPERFSASNREKMNSYAYLPFGIGPRNCIGSRYSLLKIKMLFCHLLRKFEIVPVAESKIPMRISRNNFNLDGSGFIFGLKKLNVT